MRLSPSSRRAWIEIAECLEDEVDELVALLAEGVDRNIGRGGRPAALRVALLAEGVDRNLQVVSMAL